MPAPRTRHWIASSRIAVAVFVALAGATLVASRAQVPQSGQPAQPAFRTGTTLIEVSAIVTRDGRPVADLQRDEITLLDNGEPQPLVAFERVDLGTGNGPHQRRDFVIVIDDLHISPLRTKPTIDAAIAFVDRLGPYDRLGIIHTASDDVLTFSTEREPARVRIRGLRGQGLMSAPAPGELESRARDAMDVLRQVAAALRVDAAQRSAVLLISEGHRPFSPEPRLGQRPDAEAVLFEFTRVLREAALSNVAFYTVDPRGLRAPGTAAIPSRAIDASAAAVIGIIASDLAGSLAALAFNTGGIQTRWTNDLTANFDRLLQDSRQYYRLAYVQPDPRPGKKHPSTRRIQVKVSRLGVQVRARQRYAPVNEG